MSSQAEGRRRITHQISHGPRFFFVLVCCDLRQRPFAEGRSLITISGFRIPVTCEPSLLRPYHHLWNPRWLRTVPISRCLLPAKKFSVATMTIRRMMFHARWTPIVAAGVVQMTKIRIANLTLAAARTLAVEITKTATFTRNPLTRQSHEVYSASFLLFKAFRLIAFVRHQIHVA